MIARRNRHDAPGPSTGNTKRTRKLLLPRTILLPLFFITYSLAYLDRANYGFGAAAGMAKTLHISEQRTALLGALFFAGYFAFQVPGMLLARRTSASRLVLVALVAWGILATLTGVLHNFAWLCVVRLGLGIAESAIFPAMLLLLTRWFTRAERSRANSILMLGNPVTVLWMSAITGFLIQHLGWQLTFVVEGLPAIAWAIVWGVIVRDSPSRAAWMDCAEAAALEAQITNPNLTFPVATHIPSTLLRVLLRADVLLLSLQYFFWSLGVYGFVLWLPTIIRHGAALSMSQTGLLAALPYLMAIAGELGIGYLADRTNRTYPLVWPFLLLAGIAMFGSFTFADRSFGIAFTCLALACGAMYAPYPPFFAIIPDRVPREWTGEVFALVNSAGALGGFAGSYVIGVLRAATGSDRSGDLLMSFTLIIAAALTVAIARMPLPAVTLETQHV